jgi:hypothetical protein
MACLITAGADAAAYRLQQILDQNSIFYFGDYLPLPDYSSPRKKFIQIPEGRSSSFAHELLALCLDKDIKAIYPLRRAELMPLAEAKQLFTEYGIKIFVPDKDLLPILPLMSGTLCQLAVILEGEVVFGVAAEILPTSTGVFCVVQGTSTSSLFIAG